METERIKLTIESQMENVSLAGIAVKSICESKTMLKDIAGKIELCIVEAINNCIEHAYKFIQGNPIEVELVFNENYLQIEVSDWGGSNPANIHTNFDFDPEDIENLPEGGMGLFLINEIMDEVSFFSDMGKNTLTMIKKH